MSNFIELIVNDTLFPTSTHDNYSAYEVDLKEVLNMADGSVSEELVGQVWRIEYAYDYMGMEKLRECLGVLRGGGVKTVSFTPDDSDELVTSQFLVESLTAPSLAFVRKSQGKWHNISFVLREVRPHA